MALISLPIKITLLHAGPITLSALPVSVLTWHDPGVTILSLPIQVRLVAFHYFKICRTAAGVEAPAET